jgi:hypothetical protein
MMAKNVIVAQRAHNEIALPGAEAATASATVAPADTA